MACSKIKVAKRSVCSSSFKDRIKLLTRTLQGQSFGSGPAAQESFVLLGEVWAAIETTAGNRFFDGVSLQTAYTHKVYVRYRSDVTQENFVEDADGNYYDIIEVENLDNRKEVLLLRCKLRGPKTNEANHG